MTWSSRNYFSFVTLLSRSTETVALKIKNWVGSVSRGTIALGRFSLDRTQCHLIPCGCTPEYVHLLIVLYCSYVRQLQCFKTTPVSGLSLPCFVSIQKDRQTDRQTARQTDRHMGRQASKHPDKQTDRQTDKETGR